MRLTLSLFIITISLASSAEEIYNIQLEKCMDAAINKAALINTHRIECLKTELISQERVLQVLYKKQSAQINTNQRKLLRQSHRQWLALRETWCRYEHSFTDVAPHPDVNELFCRVDLTLAYVHRLNRYSK